MAGWSPSSASSRRKCIMSLAASVRTQYSASVLERDTVGCSLLAHAMLELPMRYSMPEVDRLVLTSLPQSASA